MPNLSAETCTPVENGISALSSGEIKNLLKEIPKWRVIDVDGIPHLNRSFQFDDFAEALDFTNTIGRMAESEGHHPLIHLTWGEVTVEWWTHAISGLHRNDFIMAAKVSEANK